MMTGGDEITALMVDSNIVVKGVNKIARSTIASSAWNPDAVDSGLRSNIFRNTLELTLHTKLVFPWEEDRGKDLDQPDLLLLPAWLCKFEKVKVLCIGQVMVNNLECLKSFPVKHLIFYESVIENKTKVLSQIVDLTRLEYFAFGSEFESGDIEFIIKGLPNVSIHPYAEYFEKVTLGEILKPIL